MLGAASVLTVVTLTGLACGLAREWLLVASWGASARTDAFLIALFIPEAVRTILGGGLLSSAALALWQGREPEQRMPWLGGMSAVVGGLALACSALLWLGAPVGVQLIGPGLSPAQAASAQMGMSVLAWALPGMALQALWSVPLQAQGRFVLAGLGSLLYNLPAVICLAWSRGQTQERDLAWSFVAGSLLMGLVLLPSLWRQGWRPALLRWHRADALELGQRVWPLLGGAMVGQGLTLLERIVASYLGDGVLTVLNLARKLVNLPLLALMAVNQVLLGLMSRGGQAKRLQLLRQGMGLVSTVSTPAAIGLMLAAPSLVALLFPRVQGAAILAPVLAWYAVTLVVASWNSLLTRYSHAAGNTRLPFACELAGGAAQALALVLLAPMFGVTGMAAALLLGTLVQGALLWWRSDARGRVPMGWPLGACGGLLWVAGAWVAPRLPLEPWWQLGWATVAGALALLALALLFKPWRAPAA